MNRLDRIAVATIAVAALFIAYAIPAPFFLATLAGSGLLLWRARVTGNRNLWMPALVMPLFTLLRGPLCGLVLPSGSSPTYDAVLLALSGGIESWCWHFCWNHPLVWRSLSFAYYWALPFWMMVVMAFGPNPLQLLKRNMVAVVAALPILILCPAVGPIWFENHLVAIAPRNCMPSLHFTWALLALWYAPRWLRWPSAVVVALTAFATVGLGEHYIVDLVAAVPFTAAVCWVARLIPASPDSSFSYRIIGGKIPVLAAGAAAVVDIAIAIPPQVIEPPEYP